MSTLIANNTWKTAAYDQALWDVLFARAEHCGDSLHCSEWRYIDANGIEWCLFECGSGDDKIRLIEYRKVPE